MIDPNSLAALIASRVCHDLVSPVAGVNSALELLDDPGDVDMKAQADELLRSSAQAAAAKTQILRYAFGTPSLSEKFADRNDVMKIVNDYLAVHKPTADWSIDSDKFSFAHASVLMNLVMMATPAITRGGVLLISVRNEANGVTVSTSARGQKIRISAFVTSIMNGDVPEEGMNARTIQPYVAKLATERLGGELTMATGEETVTFTAAGMRPGA